MNTKYLILSILTYIPLSFGIAYAWKLILNGLGKRIRMKDAWRIQSYAMVSRWIPGKVWQYAGKVYLAQKLGINKSALTVSVLIELILYLVSGVMCSCYLIYKLYGDFYLYLGVGLGFFLILSLHPLCIIHVYRLYEMMFKKHVPVLVLSYRLILNILSFYIFLWIISGVNAYCIIRIFYDYPLQDVPYLVALMAIGSVMGTLAIFAPSGIGVKDGAFTYGLSAMFQLPVAVGMSGLLRAFYLVIELVALGIFLMFRKKGWQK